MYDLTNFTLSDMSKCSSALRSMGAGAESMETVAGRIVRYLQEHIVDQETGARSCVLVRFYKTHPFQDLDRDLSEFACQLVGNRAQSPAMRCLILLGTAGERSEWNSRANSIGHKAIPLPSEDIVAQFPMISQLVHQFGLDVNAVLQPDRTIIVDLDQRSYNVFYVPEAMGSPYIPAQAEFVIPFGIQSALGFGGMLPSGDLFAVILFSKVHIPRKTADMFRILALSAKVAVLPFVGGSVFTRCDSSVEVK